MTTPQNQPTESPFDRAEAALKGDLNSEFGGAVSVHHLDITCDGCEREPIIGRRFKCQVCEDRDLCEECMRGLVAARIRMTKEVSKPQVEELRAVPSEFHRPRKWISSLRSDDGNVRWKALLQAVPCLHPSHAFARMDYGPERAVVFNTVMSTQSTSQNILENSQKFLEVFRPSASNCAHLAWIVLDMSGSAATSNTRGAESDEEKRVDNALSDWDELCSVRKPNQEDVYALAERYKIRRGKWLAFPKSPQEADAVWTRIVNAAIRGDLCNISQVKVSTTNPREPGYVLCAYTEDFLDERQVEAASHSLKRTIFKMSDNRLLYKADIFTHLGIYSKNEWGIKPTIYSSKLL